MNLSVYSTYHFAEAYLRPHRVRTTRVVLLVERESVYETKGKDHGEGPAVRYSSAFAVCSSLNSM